MSEFDEIKEILKDTTKKVNELAISQAKTDEQIAKTHKEIQGFQKKTDEQIAKTHKEIQGLQKKTDEQIAKTHKEIQGLQKKTDEQIAKTQNEIQELKEVQRKTSKVVEETSKVVEETSKVVEETSKAVKKVSRLFGKSENKQSAIIEDIFHNSLVKTMTLNQVPYDFIDKNIKMKKGKKEIGEIDIILYNGNSIALIEVKTKANLNDLSIFDDLIKNYKMKHPYEQRKIYMYYGSFCFNRSIEQKAKEKGIGLLTIQGDTIESLNDSLAYF